MIERLVVRLIDTLDQQDGDADCEPDDFAEEDDHGGGADEAEVEHELFPSYGLDQGRGPTGCGWEPKWKHS